METQLLHVTGLRGAGSGSYARSGDSRTDYCVDGDRGEEQVPQSNDCLTRCAAKGETQRKDQAQAYCLTEHTAFALNLRTRLRDQERAPIAADLKRSMREKAKVDERTFALTADVIEAHRQVPVHPHLLGCQVCFVNTVGTLGIASASYYWSRVAAPLWADSCST